jgi:heme A synthase
MTSTATARSRPAPSGKDVGRRRVFAALTGLAALAILLQGLWAGMFLEHDGERDAAESWIEVHATGGEVAIGLAALATIWALVRLRGRRDLVIGAVVLTVLLVLEAYIGGLIRDEGKDSLTPLHIPLALLLMAVAVWLPFRAGRGREGSLGTDRR